MADKSVVQKKWLALYQRMTGEESPLHLSPGRQWIYFLEEQYDPRAYHNLDHIGYMRELFNIECRDLAEDPDSLEWAIWFHDAIQFTRSPVAGANEFLSGIVATEDQNFPQGKIHKVKGLISATSHKGNFLDIDSHLICDLDLAILGAVEHAYDVYEQRVHKEYEWVPEDIWRTQRVRILSDFLSRERIYQTDFWHEKLEEKARANLTRAIDALLK